MPVRVAIDGSFLLLPPSGTGTYLRALVEMLPSLDPSLDLELLTPPWEKGGTSLISRLQRDRRLRRAGWEFRGVANAARQQRVDLLHIPHFSAPPFSRTPLVVTVHDVIPLVLPEYRASRLMQAHLTVVKRTVRRARLVLTPSRAAADDIVRVLGLPRERIRVTPEAAGPEFRPTTDAASLQPILRRLGVTGRYVFNVGGFDVRKNLPVLIEAFARVRTNLDEPVQLVIAGAAHSGNPAVFPPLEPVLKKSGIENAILLPGRITEEEKRALYQGAAVYATPSLYEGFGLTALEAMACGIPTVAADRTSLPEVVGDGGLLVEPTVDAFAGAMLELLTDADRAAQIRVLGRARAAGFSWTNTVRLTLDAYREAVDPISTSDLKGIR